MFNLLTVILAIVVAIAVALAGLSYLGSAYEAATAKAVGDALVNAGQHFAGAEALHVAEERGAYAVDASPGDAMAGFVSAGYLSALPDRPATLSPSTPWAVTAQPDAAHHPYLSLGFNPASPTGRAACAYLDAQANPLFGCVSDLGLMTPYPAADGSASAAAWFVFMRTGAVAPAHVPAASPLVVTYGPGQQAPTSLHVQGEFYQYYQVSGGTPPYHSTVVGGPPEAYVEQQRPSNSVVQDTFRAAGGPYDMTLVTTDSGGQTVRTHVYGPFSVAPEPNPISLSLLSPFPTTMRVGVPASITFKVSKPNAHAAPQGQPDFWYVYTFYDDLVGSSDAFQDETYGYTFGFSDHRPSSHASTLNADGSITVTLTYTLSSDAVGSYPDVLLAVGEEQDVAVLPVGAVTVVP